MENWQGPWQEQLSRASGGARVWAMRYERTTTMRAMANAAATRARRRPTARAATTAATQRQGLVAAGWQGGPGRVPHSSCTMAVQTRTWLAAATWRTPTRRRTVRRRTGADAGWQPARAAREWVGTAHAHAPAKRMEGRVPQQQRHEQWPGRSTAAMTTHAGGRSPGASAQQRRPTRG